MDGLVSAVAVAGLGLVLLAAERLAPGGPGPMAALVPPWQTGGMARAAALGLPVLDIRWAGHLIVVDPGPEGAERLWRAGLVPLSASAVGTCLTTAEETGAMGR
jgi:hypothetical protein